jgi:spore germination cell wall hydrolase CwlJ-like protein
LATLVKTESVLNIIKTTVLLSTLTLTGCAASTEAKIVVDATTRDHKCLAEAIYYEAGSESMAGKFAVGHVVINRYQNSQYPNEICKVVYQRGYKNRGCQFGWTCRQHKPPKGIAWEQSQQVATKILTTDTEDTSKGALSFDNKRKTYSKLNKTVTIGNHSFWKPKKELKVANKKGDKK